MSDPQPSFAGRERVIDQAAIARYAQASGDFNPIHLDPEFATQTPFGGTIAHGMLLLAYVGEMMTARFGAAWLSESTLKVRFRAPARPGDRVTARGRVERMEHDAAGSERTVCAVECVNDRGETLLSGEARVTTRAS
jgi:3-hydroxybutyryl-CoA dehydratase